MHDIAMAVEREGNMEHVTHEEMSGVLSEFGNGDTVDLQACAIPREVIDRVERAGFITVYETDIGMAFFSEMQLTDRGRGRLGRTERSGIIRLPWLPVLRFVRS